MSRVSWFLCGTLSAVLCVSTIGASGVVSQLTDEKRAIWHGAVLDDAGTTVYGASTENLGGTNPSFMPQLTAWSATTGTASTLASIPPGALMNRDSVRDDGAVLAFLSRGNPTGGNPDGSLELFLMRTDGTATVQLTDTPLGAGGVRTYALAGSGNRVVFDADIDPLGSNPSMRPQLFMVEADGTGLRQLTSSTSPSGFAVSIADDGTKVAFAHRGNLTGANADLSWEIFTILHDGTDLRQLTATTGTTDTEGATGPRLAGNGSRIAFWSSETIGGLNPTQTARVWTIDWAGTNLRAVSSLVPSAEPSITDDGVFIAYASSDGALGNTDLSREIWRVRFDGTGKTRLTNTTPPTSCSFPEFAGGGTRLAFRTDGPIGSLNPDGGPALLTMDSTGGALTRIVDGREEHDRAPDLTPDGRRIVFDSTRDPFGTNPLHRRQVFRIDSDGSGMTQVTALADGDAWHPRIAGDGDTITFVADADPTGGNPSHRFELFTIRANGSGLVQLTPTAPSGLGSQAAPAISRSGNVIAFQSVGDYTGGNPDGSAELFRIHPDGTGLTQLTWDDSSVYKLPRLDDSGTWAVFQSTAGGGVLRVFRVRTDGTGFEPITTFESAYPDVSGSGERIVFVSGADPLGTNPDGSGEIFAWDVPTSTLRQVTSLPTGDIARLRISRDGAFVTFLGTAPVFEANPDGLYEPYRVNVASGTIERIGALGAPLDAGSGRYGEFVATDESGTKCAYTTRFDPVGSNRDGSSEVFLVDLTRVANTEVLGSSDTVLRWDADAHAVRYDVVRGDVSNLAILGSQVDLGPVTCIADDLPALETSSYPDGVDPEPGQVFFYVHRDCAGLFAGPGSYGPDSAGRERISGAGGCAP